MHQASLYQRANNVQRHDAKQIMDQYANVIQWRHDGHDALIDIGSGSGNVLMDFVYPLLPKNHELLMGTDISAKMVGYARKCYEAYERAKFQILDIGCDILPKQLRGRFDHVSSFYCLHWVQNQKKALQNIYQLLRCTGGDCLLVFLAKNPIFDVYKTLAQLNKWHNYMHDFEQFISPLHNSDDPGTEFGRLLHETGFADYSVEIRDEVYVYDGVNNLRDNVRAICPFLERIPAVDHEEFLDDFVSTVVNMKLRKSNDNENDFKFISPYKLVVAYARKNGVCFDSGFEFLNDIINENNREKKLN